MPWIRFMELPVLLATLDLFEDSRQEVAIWGELLEEILSALNQLQLTNGTGSVEFPFDRLLALQTQLPQSSLLEDMIAASMTSQLPVCHDGLPPTSSSSVTFAAPRFHRGGHLGRVPPDLISQYLAKDIWTDSTAKIIATLLYTRVASSYIFANWLNSGKWGRRSVDHIALTLSAFLDCPQSDVDEVTQIDKEVLPSIMEQLFSDWPVLGDKRLRRLQCICYITQRYSQRLPGLSPSVQLKFQAVPVESFAFEALHVAHCVLGVPACKELVIALLDRALRWAVRHFFNAGDHDEDSITALGILSECPRSKLFKANTSPHSENISRGNTHFKPHLVEPVMTTIVTSHLHDPAAVELAMSLVKNVELKVRAFAKPRMEAYLFNSLLSSIDCCKASCSIRTSSGFWITMAIPYKGMRSQIYLMCFSTCTVLIPVTLHISNRLYKHMEALCLLGIHGCYLS